MPLTTDKRTQIEQILDRGVLVDVLPTREEFVTALLNAKLRFYIGADPTSNTLHLSHAKNYMLLEEFRKLGHEVIVLFGDFTATIGDPSDRSSTRARLTRDEVLQNVKDWEQQIKPLMDFTAKKNPPKIMFNSKWLGALTMADVVDLASRITVQQMLERDMFEKRMAQHKPIAMHEFLYPLMQGYDSVAMDVDVEVCGTDQRFNALVGRTLQRQINAKEKFVAVVNLMENPKTGELMSKSNGTGVFLNATANDMFGQIMSLPDEMTELLLINNTRISLPEVTAILQEHPRDAKLRTAFEVTKVLHGEVNAATAREAFVKQFQKQEVPEDLPEVTVTTSPIAAFDIVRACADKSMSNSQINRLFDQKAIKINEQVVTDKNELVEISKQATVVKVGKRAYYNVVSG